VSVGPRTRVTTSNGPTLIDGARPVDRYLRALDGLIRLDRIAFDALECEFVAAASRFARLRGITYGAWRDVGVSEAVLQRAGIRQLEVVAG
jgi:hypothetical protein